MSPKKNLTSFHRPIILVILVEITSWKVNLRTSFFQQDGAPPHWKRIVCAYLNENLPEFGHSGYEDSFLMKWLSWSLDLSLCDFFLWEYMKGLCLPLFLLTLMNLSRKSLPHWIMLPEVCYTTVTDMCPVTGGARIKHL